MSWRLTTVSATRDESESARTLVLDVPGWPGHLAGQHVDVRLTAADGYTASRSYSIASAPAGERVELTIERLVDGEVSPYLTTSVAVGDPLELRGPVGGWFVWRPEQPEPVQLIAGGSGVVPLMSILRTRTAAGHGTPMRLLYSVRTPELVLFGRDLNGAPSRSGGIDVTVVYTRNGPAGAKRPPGRVDAELIATSTWPPDRGPTCYVCGPTGFVEAVADLLIAAGHEPARIRTERFGPTGGLR
ncbi:MAG TPA: ferredoxin reductase [Jiangellaceae bacterium]|nr:ferredoxin reductase [Jiangellaceae bacterium]